jgi:hypothetical protein
MTRPCSQWFGAIPKALALLITLGPYPAFAEPVEACSLVTNAEVGKVIGRELQDVPGPMSLGNGSACTYGYGAAQIIIFSGPNSQTSWEDFAKNFGHETEERHPISGIGDSAYSFFPKPRDEYENRTAFVVVQSRQYTIVTSVAAETGQQANSAEPKAIELAKLVLAKLS